MKVTSRHLLGRGDAASTFRAASITSVTLSSVELRSINATVNVSFSRFLSADKRLNSSCYRKNRSESLRIKGLPFTHHLHVPPCHTAFDPANVGKMFDHCTLYEIDAASTMITCTYLPWVHRDPPATQGFQPGSSRPGL